MVEETGFDTCRHTTAGCHLLTCDQEGAESCPCLVGDLTGVLAVAFAVERPHQVACVKVALPQLAHRQQALAQLPLVAQQAGRVGPQEAAGQTEGPAERLPHLSISWLHHGGIWRLSRHRTSSNTEDLRSQKELIAQSISVCLVTAYNIKELNDEIEKSA